MFVVGCPLKLFVVVAVCCLLLLLCIVVFDAACRWYLRLWCVVVLCGMLRLCGVACWMLFVVWCCVG